MYFLILRLIVNLATAVKLVLFHSCDRKYLLEKTISARIFSIANRKHKFFTAAGRIPNFGPSYKMQTLYMIPFLAKEVLIFHYLKN